MDGETIPEAAYDLPDYSEELVNTITVDPNENSSGKRSRTDSDPGSPTGQIPPTLQHFKVTFDSSWTQEDYLRICDHVFGDSPQVLVVAEKMKQNAHVHFQGYTRYSHETFKKRRTIAKDMHYTQKPGIGARKGARPVTGGDQDRPVNATGFQYMCKEPPSVTNPVYSRGFTPEQLAELHEKSNAYVENLKFNTFNYVTENVTAERVKTMDPKTLLSKCLLMIAFKLRETKKMKSRHTRTDVINALLHHPDAPPPLLEYLMNLT